MAVQNKPGFQLIRGSITDDAEFVGNGQNSEYEFVAIAEFQPHDPDKDLETLTLLIPAWLWERRFELFRAGHHLFVEGIVDKRAPAMYLSDAWYWRGQGL